MRYLMTVKESKEAVTTAVAAVEEGVKFLMACRSRIPTGCHKIHRPETISMQRAVASRGLRRLMIDSSKDIQDFEQQTNNDANGGAQLLYNKIIS